MKNDQNKFQASVILPSYTTRPVQGWAFAESATSKTNKSQGWSFSCSDTQGRNHLPCSSTLSNIRHHVGHPFKPDL